MDTDIAALEALRILREKVLDRICASGKTLRWFAKQPDVPLNIWRNLDRPLPQISETLGPDFEIWHALIRAERTLRQRAPREAAALRESARELRKKLDSSAAPPDESEQSAGAAEYARRLTSDQVFGTHNALTAAAVMRSELFPERSAATPSYIAGHIVFCELQVARSQAGSPVGLGIRDRTPRLGIVSQAVHSVMLYVQHLERRATVFRALSREIASLQRLHLFVGSRKGPVPNVLDEVWDGQVRLSASRMATLCREASDLLLATRDFFTTWEEQLRDLARNERNEHKASLKELKATFSASRPVLGRRTDDAALKPRFDPQQRAYDVSIAYAGKLHNVIGGVCSALSNLLETSHSDFGVLLNMLKELRDSLEELAALHNGAYTVGTYPSIRDAARFQFARSLVEPFDSLLLGDDLRKRGGLAAKLKVISDRYLLGVPRGGQDVTATAFAVFEGLGRTEIGKNLLRWWENYRDCYWTAPTLTQPLEQPAGGHAEPRFSWLRQRHRSFSTILSLARGIRDTPELFELAPHFTEAADELTQVAKAVRNELKALTQWCTARGHQLLSAARSGTSESADAHELAAALWIAERLSESLNERFEAEAFEVIQSLQKRDGSFPTAAPLYKSRGFTFSPSSASTIALLAHFCTGGTLVPKSARLRQRLELWSPVLLNGATYLCSTMVGRRNQPDDGETEGGGESEPPFAGWHSDRHPETERIDCLATADAVTALCRLDDALRWLINGKAAWNFDTGWRRPQLNASKPIDVAAGPRQLLLTVDDLVRSYRGMSDLYTSERAADRKHWGRPTIHTLMAYGPPGTGKTYLQEVIAGELGWPLITLTMGDFLQAGGNKVGQQAVGIFKRLSYLSHVCIVFDEFDEIVSERAHKSISGSAGFPLLTAAMLPLLSNLRETARRQCCLASFTTNFLEDIDQAARRAGRVDKPLLMMYMDYPSRLLFALVVSAELETLGHPPESWSDYEELAFDTALLSRPDVASYLDDALSNGRAAASRRRPPHGVNADYYDYLLRVGRQRQPVKWRRDVADSIDRLFRSIGGQTQVARWLEKNREWKPLNQELKRQGSPSENPSSETTQTRRGKTASARPPAPSRGRGLVRRRARVPPRSR